MYTLTEIARICGEKIIEQGNTFSQSPLKDYCYDTRTIRMPGETVFIALSSGHRDGHAYIQDAYNKGVRNFIVHTIPDHISGNFLKVRDTLEALQKIATWHRSQFRYPVIGITGSNGKTIVKEWISALLNPETELVRSPGSFNSQIGVPVSVLRMRPEHELAIFEAGISRTGEMQKLEEIIRPDLMVLTHLGDAHAEGFVSFEEKVKEKLILGKRALCVLTLGNQRKYAEKLGLPVKSIGQEDYNEVQIKNLQEKSSGWSFRIGQDLFSLYQDGPAALENALIAIFTCMEYGIPLSVLAERTEHLQAVSMRMEMITDNPRTTVLNDAFTADPDSVRNAFRMLSRFNAQPRKIVILTDLDHLGKATLKIQENLMQEAFNLFGMESVILIGPVFKQLTKGTEIRAWENLHTMLQEIPRNFFEHAAVLIKGARRFSLEQLVPVLSERVSATCFRINLNTLLSNYRILKSRIHTDKKIMAMVKASSYGSGSWEIAQELESEGVNYLAVAYITEGIALREHGIRTPVMVMNPDPEGLRHLYEYRLEPVVYSLPFLNEVIKEFPSGKTLKVHIEVETGMMRLGFPASESEALVQWLKNHPSVEVASVFTHLAASESPEEDDFTRQQFTLLKDFSESLKSVRTGFLVHAQNTAGALRFSESWLDMVRLGIGLYGVSPLTEPVPGLKETGSLVSKISQIHACPKGSTVGYNRRMKAERDMKIATIALGYADGIPRSLSNGKAGFIIKGKTAPVTGTICMDMIMLDVTDIPGVKAGDEVLIFGYHENMYQSVEKIAQAAETISYEIITGIHPRVRRIYIRE